MNDVNNDRRVLDLIQSNKHFTEHELIENYFGDNQAPNKEEEVWLKGYMKSLCKIGILKKKWFRKEYILIKKLE